MKNYSVFSGFVMPSITIMHIIQIAATIQLTLLIIIHIYSNREQLPTAIGGIIMAIGVFSLYAFQELPFANMFATRLIASALIVLWSFIAMLFLMTCKRQGFSLLHRNTGDTYGIGTWVAGTSILGILISIAFPINQYAAIFIVAFTCYLWLLYLSLIFRQHIQLTDAHTGIILLLTVSTQSMALLLHDLLPNMIPKLIFQALISLGYIFYIIEFRIFIKFYSSIPRALIIKNWNSANSIVHGALSISGLAGLLTGTISTQIIISTWGIATCFLIATESLSIIKLSTIIISKKVADKKYQYDVSQWARCFTFGMYYAFTYSLLDHNVASNFIILSISEIGQYIVLIILIIELIIFLRNKSIQHPVTIST